MKESELVDLFKTNKKLQEQFSNIVGFEKNFQLVNEDTFINGIRVDFTVLVDGEIVALIECKGDDIGVTDFVRGIGQITQYKYFFNHLIDPKGRGFNENCKIILLFPSDLLINNKFNIGKFGYPEDTLLIEVNNHNKFPRIINNTELNKLARENSESLQTISHYYVRDTRVFELYILLRHITIAYFKGKKILNRSTEEEFLVKNIKVINNGNWRNVFITLQSLGLMDSNNLPTKVGVEIIYNGYENFAYEVYESYIKPYFEEIINVCDDTQLNLGIQEILTYIKNKYNNKDIMYLTESNGRCISSWLNIMRDDYGIFDFESRTTNRKLIYNITDLKKEVIIKKIKENSVASTYINNYNKTLN